MIDRLAGGVVQVIDSIHEDGPKLVRMSRDAAQRLEEAGTGLRAVAVKEYQPAFSPREAPRSLPSGATAGRGIAVTVRCADGAPAVGVKVVAYTSTAAGEGDAAITDASGTVTLRLGSVPVRVETLWIEAPPSGCWDAFRRDCVLANQEVIELPALDAAYRDCVRSRCAPFSRDAGAGVKVAVIDTGVGPHPDLVVADGMNSVTGESKDDYGDNGMGHGTHVAGIICGRPAGGAPPGISPAADLWAGRVYAEGTDRATNYSIMKSMIMATDARCDLLNLSLASDDSDPVLQDAVADALASGAVVFAATGNKGKAVIGSPARCDGAIAVSAYGWLSTYPTGTFHDEEIGARGEGDAFFASFSNYGSGVSFIGPGVGVISAGPRHGYAVRSGTSMACAAVTGMAARLLGADQALLTASRDLTRSRAIRNLLQSRATRLGLGFEREGSGTL